MATKILALLLVFIGVVFCAIGTPYNEGMIWFGPYDKVKKSEAKKQTRFAILGLIFIFAGVAVWKFAAVPQ